MPFLGLSLSFCAVYYASNEDLILACHVCLPHVRAFGVGLIVFGIFLLISL